MPAIRTSLVAVLIAASTPCFAQASAGAPAQAQITVGASVTGPQGAPVGTVTEVTADYVNVKTDKYDVRLPRAAFAPHGNGWAVTTTQADLNASIEKALASRDALLTQGTPVAGSQGAPVGTIDAVEGDLVTLKLTSGKLVRLPKTGFAPGPNGLVIGLTAQQLEAQASAAQ